MRDNDPNRWLLLLFRWWLALLMIVLLIGLLRGYSGVLNYLALQKSHKILADKVSLLVNETRYLSDEIERIETSKSYAMRIYKDKYHVTEEGESILFFTEQ